MRHLLIVSFFLLIPSPLQAGQKFTRTQLLMGDVPVSITIRSTSAQKASALEAMERAFAEARRIEARVSEWRPESDATRINSHPGLWIPISREMREILALSRQVSEWTEGAFDITFQSPDRRATYRDVEVVEELSLGRVKRRGVRIGVSGIAKGYIVDQMGGVLRRAGFRKFLVDAGDIYGSGKWTIGIRDPDHPSGEPICEIQVQDEAVSTSGLYERGPHIRDPVTREVPRHFKGMTVIAKKSVLADALATGAFVLEKGKLQGVAGKVSGLSVLYIDSGGEVGTVGRVSARCRRRCN